MRAKLDDLGFHRGHVACIFLGCNLGAAGAEHPMPKELRRQVIAALAPLAVVA